MHKEFDDLLLSGAIEPAGIDSETGEILYNFTSKLQSVYPELYNQAQTMINRDIMKLWEKGFIEIDLMDESPMAKLTLKAFNDSETSKLSKDDLFVLNEVKRICSNE